MSPTLDNLGNGRISRLVGRLRSSPQQNDSDDTSRSSSNSEPEVSQHLVPSNLNHPGVAVSATTINSKGLTQDGIPIASADRPESPHSNTRIFKTPSFKTFSSGSHSSGSHASSLRKSSDSSSIRHARLPSKSRSGHRGHSHSISKPFHIKHTDTGSTTSTVPTLNSINHPDSDLLSSSFSSSSSTSHTKQSTTSTTPFAEITKTKRGTTIALDAPLSLDLWNTSYDHLRDNPATAGLVVAFESIVCQELPDQLKQTGGMSMTFRDLVGGCRGSRWELMETIAVAGMMKRRGSRGSEVEDTTVKIVDASKDAVGEVMEVYPSAAVAWCGLCTLTPLLLEPLIRRSPSLRNTMIHITGRIHWYMTLTQILNRKTWLSDASFAAQRPSIEDLLRRLYRKVLEVQMIAVCATASTWNRAAKNVVDWQGFEALERSVEELDEEIRGVLDREVVDGVERRVVMWDRDLDMEVM